MSRVLGRLSRIRGREERLEEGIIVREQGPPNLWEDPWGQMSPNPLNEVVLPASSGKIFGLEPISGLCLLYDLERVTIPSLGAS